MFSKLKDVTEIKDILINLLDDTNIANIILIDAFEMQLGEYLNNIHDGESLRIEKIEKERMYKIIRGNLEIEKIDSRRKKLKKELESFDKQGE